MKKNILASYWHGIIDSLHGEGYKQIARYFFPEFITAIILYSVPLLIDARWIAHLKSTSAYAALGITNTLLHSVIKIAEGISVGIIVSTGQSNGVKNFKKAGESFMNAFWLTVLTGAFVATGLYLGAYRIFGWYRMPSDMVLLGAPFLRLRAIGIFFMFVYFALIGFLRAIKNTQIPMRIFSFGCFLFLVCDYVFIFGGLGIAPLGLMGSALASVVQYVVMVVVALWYLIKVADLSKYEINLWRIFLRWERSKELIFLSLPVMIDKAALSFCYVWLGFCLAPMGTLALASFSVIKDIERFALLPAIAFAQVVTFLVSNDYGRRDWDGIKNNIKKIIFLSAISVFCVLLFCSYWPVEIIRVFDFKGEFTSFAAQAFPVISVLAFFDVLQLILAGALRGAANVKTVMWTRLVSCALFFAPFAFFCSRVGAHTTIFKFVLIYSSLYLCNAVMSLVYVRRFRSEDWKKNTLEGVNE